MATVHRAAAHHYFKVNDVKNINKKRAIKYSPTSVDLLMYGLIFSLLVLNVTKSLYAQLVEKVTKHCNPASLIHQCKFNLL